MIKVGITHGDINGVSYEVLLKTFEDLRIAELCVPVIYGSVKVASYHRKALNLPPVSFNQIQKADDAETNKVNILNCISEDIKIEFGKSTDIASNASQISLETAIQDLEAGLIDLLVTAPINKENFKSEDFDFSDQTRFLESRFADNEGQSLKILIKDNLRVAFVTEDIPLVKVPAMISIEKIKMKALSLNRSLERDFKIQKPRIAILSLNPNIDSGEGKEEEEIIIPAIKELQDKEMLCFGPYAVDDFFGSGHYTSFDGILAMYYDQGAAPFKTLTMEDGVNFTAGLSIVRTSPTHGPRYDIVGKNEASETSFRNAVYLAMDIYRARKNYDKAYAHPLRKLYHEKGGDNEVLDLTKEDSEV